MKTATANAILFFSAAFLAGGCGVSEVEQKQEEEVEIGNIHGRWILEQIVYDNGDTLKAPTEPLYWFELQEDSVFAEQSWHYSLVGQSNCNSCFGYFDYEKENQSINISFICQRLVCGIATEFAITIATSFKYSFQDGNLLLFFDSVSQNTGRVILKPGQ